VERGVERSPTAVATAGSAGPAGYPPPVARPNRLAGESSPYLRQHAGNPVDWYPWGDEAFAEARRRDVPVLLSVGYSSCHWCHVMANESFADGPTATIMNRLFVNVKVDREERPDVDAVYMEAVQAFTGRGGWPMTVFLLPDGRPFFGGTYFPKSPRHGMSSFTELLERVHDVWRYQRAEIEAQAGEVADLIARSSAIEPDPNLPGIDALHTAGATLLSQFDRTWGGFGRAPKFPQSMALDAMLRLHAHTGDPALLDAVMHTLDAMASGGMWDHIAFGFARYSTDERWAIPHFEKMLYDNALLLRVYLHAWQVTGEARYLQVCRETVAYIARDMTHELGGFFSAQDADSEHEEGRFALWTIDEVRDVLAGAGLAEHTDAVVAWYGLTEQGNFEGRNNPVRAVRGDLLRPPHVEAARRALFARRAERVQPGLDDKVLTEWNALLLASLAELAAATGDPLVLELARRNATFLRDHLRVDGRWYRSWQENSGARHLAYAADHAAVVDAFVRLAEATGERIWLDDAITTADAMLELFADHDNGGLFTTGADAEVLLTRPKDIVDNAVPSANSAAAVALLRLAARTGIDRYRDHAAAVLRLVGGAAATHPAAFGHALAAIDLLASGITEIVVAGDRTDLVEVARRAYLPNAVLAWGERDESPLWEGRHEPAAYVCRDFTCLAPAADPATLRTQLGLR
jgi:uncharacterized protein YyaL (SSP411 family)